MAQERILIEIVTAANLAGVEAAKKELLGFNVSTLALAAVLFAAMEVGKQAIENYKAQEEALLSLHQATDTTHQDYGKMESAVESFIDTNKAYISNQYDVIAASALIVRAGRDEKETLQLLNDALDLSAIKHEDVSVAAKSLILAESGNAKALKELGITTEQYSAIMKDKKLTAEQKDAELLALIESKTKDGKKATDANSQSQNKLTNEWQHFTADIGPGLVTVQTDFNNLLAGAVDLLDQADRALVALGKDGQNPVWGNLQNFLEILAGKPVQDGIRALLALLGASGSTTQAPPSGGNQRLARGTRASGGPVDAGGAYVVGENGPEMLVMGSGGGNVIPNGALGGGGVTHHWHIGTLIATDRDFDRLAQRLLRGARARPGT